MSSLTIADWLMVAAVLLAPLIAIQVQKRLEIARERRNAKLKIFHTLMATRAARVSGEHVQALNMIDIEFYGSRVMGYMGRSAKEKSVVDAWKFYLDHLNNRRPGETPEAWVERGDDLFTDLLYVLSRALDYDFDKVHLKRGIYAPQAHGQFELEQAAIRQGMAKVLSGQSALPITLVQTPAIGDGNVQNAEDEGLEGGG